MTRRPISEECSAGIGIRFGSERAVPLALTHRHIDVDAIQTRGRVCGMGCRAGVYKEFFGAKREKERWGITIKRRAALARA